MAACNLLSVALPTSEAMSTRFAWPLSRFLEADRDKGLESLSMDQSSERISQPDSHDDTFGLGLQELQHLPWQTQLQIQHGLSLATTGSEGGSSFMSHEYHVFHGIEAENKNDHTVSPLFPPSFLVNGQLPDIFLCSSDMVLFYVHIPILLAASYNNFGGWLIPELIISASSEYPSAIYATESSHVLSVALCIIYGCELPVPCPPLPIIEQGIAVLVMYGIPPKTVLTPEQPVYIILCSYLEQSALEVYALAAQHDIYALACEASAYLLGYPFIRIPDDMARKMGGVYMHRLGGLQIHRVEEFKRILLEKPKPHKETLSCRGIQQAALMRSYTLSVAYMVWDARPDFPVTLIQDSILNLGMKLDCAECRASLSSHLKEIITKWLIVKRTI